MMITVKYDSQKNQLSKYKSMSWRFPHKLSTIILAILVMAGAYFISPVSIAYAELNDLPSAILLLIWKISSLKQKNPYIAEQQKRTTGG